MSDQGRVWKFGNDVNTDVIISGKHLDNYDPAHLASHAMEGANKDFASGVRQGDIIIAGANFGCGSSREQAVMALKHSGVEAVIARSFARIFYRNAINLGLTVAVSPSAADVFQDGDSVVLDLPGHRLVSSTDNRLADLEPVPAHVKMILDEGGLVPFIKKRLKERGVAVGTELVTRVR
jgi:3-isopropylmalate/(R)-2-methylmalate dehydratase small subunit